MHVRQHKPFKDGVEARIPTVAPRRHVSGRRSEIQSVVSALRRLLEADRFADVGVILLLTTPATLGIYNDTPERFTDGWRIAWIILLNLSVFGVIGIELVRRYPAARVIGRAFLGAMLIAAIVAGVVAAALLAVAIITTIFGLAALGESGRTPTRGKDEPIIVRIDKN